MSCSPSHMIPEKNLGGRPREHDRDQIANELIEWAKLDDSINLNGFCCTREPPIAPSKLTVYSNECPRFRQAYELAKAFLGNRRERKLSNNELHVKAYDLNAAVYDYYLKEEKRDQARFEAELGKDKANAAPAELVAATAQLISEVSQERQSRSERRIADSKSKADSKS